MRIPQQRSQKSSRPQCAGRARPYALVLCSLSRKGVVGTVAFLHICMNLWQCDHPVLAFSHRLATASVTVTVTVTVTEYLF
jgi:hypothetical protein